ncbi:MAG: UDP-N-acetylmuramoyl-L-alanyl-D-glutamate--2,6-diaminopimelate ligase [Deltaproteobacteria bacterium]|nr:UDP-N-acetylmuramoyl-L-alanyl-D-glutamate--2,6-diaminopimelate ligase [Deltaproteobacteria bacterium]
MKLKDLLEVLSPFEIQNLNEDIEIKGIAYNSRDVKKGSLFAALKGENTDGYNFIPDAVKNGAAAIVSERIDSAVKVPEIIVPDSRDAMAKLACRFYGEPSRKLNLVGVTGTNGKTTTTFLIESILKQAGLESGVIGTINYRYRGKILDASHTTPESPDLQRLLKDMADNGVTNCVMEVSSHALSQKRVDGCIFKGGVFTNLTQDHLDYHKTMEDYFESKARLFEEFLPQSEDCFAVINIDDEWGRLLKVKRPTIVGAPKSKVKTIEYSLNAEAMGNIFPKKMDFTDNGIEASLSTPIGSIHISSKLLGKHNLQNIMAAVGAGIGLGLKIDVIEKGISNLKTVEGRIERVSSKKGFQAVIDYAHTGDALERLLTTIRDVAGARVITVFGCGGNRDRGKRPIMGEIAARFSNITIITSDNPRDEDPLAIIKEIEAGVKGQDYMIIPDRKEAIEKAVTIAEAGDFIVIAGKGHEKYQIIGDKKIPFDDVEEVRKAMNNE